jgi:hypothetical protein
MHKIKDEWTRGVICSIFEKKIGWILIITEELVY